MFLPRKREKKIYEKNRTVNNRYIIIDQKGKIKFLNLLVWYEFLFFSSFYTLPYEVRIWWLFSPNHSTLQIFTVSYRGIWIKSIVFIGNFSSKSKSMEHLFKSFFKHCQLGKFRESNLFWINWRWCKHCLRNNCSLRKIWKLPSELHWFYRVLSKTHVVPVIIFGKTFAV